MLIDTNVWSELTRPRPDAKVLNWITAHFDKCILSAMVIAEMRYGIAFADDPARRIRLQTFHDDLLGKFRVTPFDDRAAAAWGPMRADLQRRGKLIGERDMLIAAHALALDTPLVTRDVSDMAKTGTTIINPWDV
ncbi:PIN domain-containing protein [Sandaracinobacteroides saxicola]|uniref:Ribonuclease VapC n=1 Tax=Sandaracinobacteroides saxicola TaxID=2759707 RepID=A0A7G5IDU1_9SPHN|nr:PIN domain-containing protein [Sandaracinobacteroides saxicola]QMW21533.1 PIN domain-containing protein [Sandaracinobacteroides saxicola]